MNDEQKTPPPDEHDDTGDKGQLPRSPDELLDALKAIQNENDPTGTGEDNTKQPSTPSDQDVGTADQGLPSASPAQQLPRSKTELRSVVREIVQEVLQDVEAVRTAAAEPVEIVTIPQFMIPRLRMSPKQILAAVATAMILIGAPITWATWPTNADLPDGAVGLWETITPSYSDRAFRLTHNTITFHVSPQDSTYHPIVLVQETAYMEEEGTTTYTVTYTHYRDDYEFSFLYREEPDTTIRFINQKEMTWRKGSS